MSLDENALNSYREQHKLNQTQHQQKREQTLAIPQSSLVTSSTKITLNSDNSNNNLLLSASNTIPASQRGAKLTIAPHPNFISLRSGSDSVHSSWIKSQGRSCDYSDDVMSSLSLQQPTLNQNRSSSPLNNAPPPTQSRNFIPLTSQRPINPMSSLRRHMFVNSRRHAQTTGDELRAYDDSITNNELSYEMVNSVSIASTNQLASLFLNSANANETDNNNNNNNLAQPVSKETPPTVDDESKQAPAKEYADPNLLNPSWIPLIVRRTLLEMHEQAVLSKSDSNIKSKYRSSNHLLHSPASKVNKESKMLKSNRKKKPLSLQNSQDKSTFVSVSPNTNTSRVSATGVSNNSFSNFYDELRSKIFHSSSPSNKSTSPSNPNSTILSGTSKPESKRSIDQQNSLNSISGLSGSNNFSTRSSLSNTTVILNPNSNSETINLISLSPKSSIGKPV